MLIHIINHKGSQESVAICSLDSNIYTIPPPPRNPIWKQNKEMKTAKLMLRLRPLVNPFPGCCKDLQNFAPSSRVRVTLWAKF